MLDFLVSNLGEEDAEFVGDVGDGVVAFRYVSKLNAYQFLYIYIYIRGAYLYR